ncbi:unnamed protein product, partial [Prorocentrum cordatum]
AAIGKTHKSPLTLIASAVDASTYWTGRLNEYIEKLPAMLQHRNAIQHAEGVIRAYNPSECDLDKLMGTLESLVGVEEAIRTGGIDALLTNIARSIKETRVYVMRLPQEEMEITSKWSRVVGEASLLFPMDLWVDEFRTEAANKLASSSMSAKVSSLVSGCAGLKNNMRNITTHDARVPIIQTAIANLKDIAGTTPIPGEYFTSEGLSIINEQCEVCATVAAHLVKTSVPSSTDSSLKTASDFAAGVVSIATVANSKTLQKMAKVIQAGCALQLSCFSFCGDHADVDAMSNDEKSMKVLPDMMQALVEMQESLAALGQSEAEFYATMSKVSADAKEFIGQVTAKGSEKATTNLVAINERMATLGRGLPAELCDELEGDWYSTFTGKTFKELLVHAEGTLLKCDIKATIAVLGEAAQALKKYKHALGQAVRPVDDGLVADTAKRMGQCKTVKALGCLLNKFRGQCGLEELRAFVQAEIREFRQNSGLKEKDCFPPLVLQRVVLALQLKAEEALS